MPRKKSGDFDEYQYQQDYIKSNLKFKNCTFNLRKPEDVAILEWIDSQPEGATRYIKRLIKEDYERHKSS